MCAPPAEPVFCKSSTIGSAPSSRRSWATCSPPSKPNSSALRTIRHLALQRLPQPRFDGLWNRLRLHSFIYLQGFQSGVDNHETVGALVDMRGEADLDLGVYVRVEVI